MKNLQNLLFKKQEIDVITTKEIQIWNERDIYNIAFEVLDLNGLLIDLNTIKLDFLKNHNLIYYTDSNNDFNEQCICIPKNSKCKLKLDLTSDLPNNVNEVKDLVLCYEDFQIWTEYNLIKNVIKVKNEN